MFSEDDDLADDFFGTFFLRVVVFFFAVDAAGFRVVEVFLALRGTFFFAFTFAFGLAEEDGLDEREVFFRTAVFFFAVPEDAVRFFAPDLAAIKKGEGFGRKLTLVDEDKREMTDKW